MLPLLNISVNEKKNPKKCRIKHEEKEYPI